MSLFGGIKRRDNPGGNPDGLPGPIDYDPGRTWWLVPAVLLGVFFLGRKLKPANK